MNNDIYDTGNVSNTQNPQGNAPAPGASNGADFQSTADQDALNSQTDNLTVQETGEPVVGVTDTSSGNELPMGWMIIIGVSLVIAIIVVVKIIKDLINEDKATPKRAPAKVSTTTVKKKSAAKTKSVSRTGKKKPTKKTKKRSSKKK